MVALDRGFVAGMVWPSEARASLRAKKCRAWNSEKLRNEIARSDFVICLVSFFKFFCGFFEKFMASLDEVLAPIVLSNQGSHAWPATTASGAWGDEC